MSEKTVQPGWAWWEHLLRTGEFQSPLQDGVVHFGYYRRSSDKKGANARWIPIGIWGTAKGVVCEVDGKRVPDISKPPWRPFDLLFHRSLQAVSHETYMAVTRQKAPWPDAPPMLHVQPQNIELSQLSDPTSFDVPAADREVDRHHNEPPVDQRLLVDKRAQLTEETLLVQKRLETAITNQEQANSVSEHANRIANLSKWFEQEYEVRNRPLLEQQKVLRTDYLHPAQEATALAKTLTQHIAAFLLQEQKKLEIQQQVAAQAEAARLQALAEAAAAKGEVFVPEEPPPGAAPLPKRASAGGLTGRKTTVSEENVGTVTDYMAFAEVLIRGNLANPPPGYCATPELKRVLDERAVALAKKLPKDQQISGLRIERQAKARR